MFLPKNVFVALAWYIVLNYVFVTGQDSVPDELEEQPAAEEEEEEKAAPPQDKHTFVALIDIVFTDGRKRTCTGTIIHDNVVITAAHCFIDHSAVVEPELTASFVVIGTKKMYDTGYENYLPIERVVIHPRYKGWTADLALVYTFAGMTSDKPGNVIPLVGEKTMTPVDSNVTVLSWGHCRDEPPPQHTRATPVSSTAAKMCGSSEELIDDSCEPKSTVAAGRSGLQRYASFTSENEESSVEPEQPLAERMLRPYEEKREKLQKVVPKAPKQVARMQPTKAHRLGQYRRPPVTNPDFMVSIDETTKVLSRYLSSSEAKPKKRDKSYTTQRHRYHKTQRNSSAKNEDKNIMIIINTEDLNFRVNEHNRNLTSHNGDPTRRREESQMKQAGTRRFVVNADYETPKEKSMQTYFDDWRRQMGPKQNKLTVEVFGFVNVQTCKKLVDKALPPHFEINPNHVVCYATEDHYINDEDAGAPAIRRGHLVAVTVGGVECDGDHVAVGMKMSCFCPWIAKNLPDDAGKHIKCCKNCCESRSREEKQEEEDKKHKN